MILFSFIIDLFSDNYSKMEHISAPPTIVDIAECHHALFARDKLWLISRKGE